ncbi:lipopolysaccharide biosynthesis protein [Virgibacillus chiguensis]|uniref:Membrane protein involved in the export of O-antigen and teichoic acid n=1 Tax=Virgibacillus chiguensis TaxID=411959 RepID=A0A1M5QL49_9BACI|nr:oligosaccharide flippase family protein [Virgibacillus chiguensis]SHH14521.1 Membrane protein involved in the export of O-antigen and teichoic acid [Virgibacillus chiguensis]
MINKLVKIKNSTFVQNTIILASGTMVAQVIALLSSPIITRIYGPEIFGLMGVFLAINQIFIPVSSLTYPISIVLPKDYRNAKKLAFLSIMVSVLLSLIVALIILFLGDYIVELFKIQQITQFLFLIPIVIVFSGFSQVATQWLVRTKEFAINAKVSVYQSILINGGKVGIGLLYPTAAVLIILTALANGVRAIMLFLFMQLKRQSNSSKYENTDEKQLTIGELAKKYKDFPLYRAPEVFINSISQRFPVLMLTSFFGPAIAGFYTLGNTVLQQPIRLIGDSVGNVFYPRITEASHKKESLTKLILKATVALSLIGIIPFGIIIFLGPCLFSAVFGDEWVTAGKYAQWIGVFLFCEFINKPAVKSLPVLSAQLFQLLFTIITFIVRICALAIGYFVFKNDLFAISLFSISSAILHIVFILIVIGKSKSFDKKHL